MKKKIIVSLIFCVSVKIIFSDTLLATDVKIKFKESTKKPVFQSKKAIKPGDVCLKFLRWYVADNLWLRNHHLFKITEPGDTAIPYKVDYDNVTSYKARLKSTKLVSNEFLQNIQMQYDSAARYLKLNPQFDGPIENFSIDPVIQLQEPDMLTQHIKSIRLKSVRFEYGFCYVTVKVSRDLSYVFVLSNQKKKWLIDSVLPRFER